MKSSKKISRKEYTRIHWWLRKHYGKANHCEYASCDQVGYAFHWALKYDHKHDYKRENYLQLCQKCHNSYDATFKNRELVEPYEYQGFWYKGINGERKK